MDFSLKPQQDSERFISAVVGICFNDVQVRLPDLRNVPGEPVRLETINLNESTDATDHYKTRALDAMRKVSITRIPSLCSSRSVFLPCTHTQTGTLILPMCKLSLYCKCQVGQHTLMNDGYMARPSLPRFPPQAALQNSLFPDPGLNVCSYHAFPTLPPVLA